MGCLQSLCPAPRTQWGLRGNESLSKSCASRGDMATGEEPKGACARLCSGARASGDAESEAAGADAGRRRRLEERRPGEGRMVGRRGAKGGEKRGGEGAREAARAREGGGSWGKEGHGEGREGRGEGARRGAADAGRGRRGGLWAAAARSDTASRGEDERAPLPHLPA